MRSDLTRNRQKFNVNEAPDGSCDSEKWRNHSLVIVYINDYLQFTFDLFFICPNSTLDIIYTGWMLFPIIITLSRIIYKCRSFRSVLE